MKTTMLAVSAVLFLLTGCFKATGEGADGSGGGTASAGGGTSSSGGGATGGSGGGEVSPDRLEISPASVTVPKGQTVAARALLVFNDGQSEDVTARANWSTDSQNLAGVEQGVVRGLIAGEGTLIATLEKRQATAVLKVIDQTVTGLVVTPARLKLPQGASAQVSVLATLSGGTSLDVTALATYSSSAAGVFTVAPGGQVRAIGGGTASLTVSYGGVLASALVDVTVRKAVAVTVAPPQLALARGTSGTLTASARFDDETFADVSASATWSSSSPGVQVSSAGVVHGVSSGSATVTATFQGLSGTSSVNVFDSPLKTLSVTPPMATVAKGIVQPFTATGTYADGHTADLTATAVFSASPANVASVSNAAGSRGLATGLSAGTATITASVGAVSGSAQLQVLPQGYKSLEVQPAVLSVQVGASVSATVIATRADGTKEDVSGTASVALDTPSLGSVAPAVGGLTVKGLAAGTTTLRATFGGLQATAALTVTPATSPLVALEVAPNALTLTPGKSLPVKAMARFADAHVEDVSEQASWSSSNTTVAVVSSVPGSRGLVSGSAVGSADVTATYQGKSAVAKITVAQRAVLSLSLAPSQVRLPQQNYEYMEASLAYNDGTTENVSTTVTWSTTNASVAEVQVFQGGGGDSYAYLVSGNPGTATITATTAQGQSATCTVTVTNATLTSLDLTPAQPRLAPGSTVDMALVGVFSDLSTRNLKYWATWTSSNPAVATVDNSQTYNRGKVKAMGPGTAVITVDMDGVTTSTTVTVSSATITQVQVTPFAPKLPVGFDTYFRATVVFSDNTTQDVSYEASWTSSATSVASVNSYGQVRPIGAGQTRISANYQGVVGSEQLTVTGASLSSIAVGPVNPTIGEQVVKQLTATGTFADGFVMDITGYCTWLSSDQAVAKVSNAAYQQGQVKGLSPGSTTVSALRGNVGGNTLVTVSPTPVP
ncbi:MAG: Ig-like domain-containing protein [Myxococcaceae bacterium]|nr:Ig-like domain-containing protein [Myxococcaceae bacterium]